MCSHGNMTFLYTWISFIIMLRCSSWYSSHSLIQIMTDSVSTRHNMQTVVLGVFGASISTSVIIHPRVTVSVEQQHRCPFIKVSLADCTLRFTCFENLFHSQPFIHRFRVGLSFDFFPFWHRSLMKVFKNDLQLNVNKIATKKLFQTVFQQKKYSKLNYNHCGFHSFKLKCSINNFTSTDSYAWKCEILGDDCVKAENTQFLIHALFKARLIEISGFLKFWVEFIFRILITGNELKRRDFICKTEFWFSLERWQSAVHCVHIMNHSRHLLKFSDPEEVYL
jgi:hypothetical protein